MSVLQPPSSARELRLGAASGSASWGCPARTGPLLDLPNLARLVGHGALVLLVSTAALLGAHPEAEDPAALAPQVVQTAYAAPTVPAARAVSVTSAHMPAEDPGVLSGGRAHLGPAVLPATAGALRLQVPLARPRQSIHADPGITLHVVQYGDSIASLAKRYGLRPETIIWANDETNPSPSVLTVGDTLVIPPVDGVCHVARKGETLEDIAARYLVAPEAILGYRGNGLRPGDALTPGQTLVVPGGVCAQVVRSPAEAATALRMGTLGRLAHPVAGILSNRYAEDHPAIDLWAPLGTPVLAAADGVVVEVCYLGADRSAGYGRWVVIDHGDGLQTLYAHLASTMVVRGEYVTREQQIGTCGNVGRSNAPHVHFEVRAHGQRVNPIYYLP